jgi:type III pantothenate kinase
VGGSTEECMRSGAFLGVLHELQGTIDAYKAEHGLLNVILCGGDAKFFESIIKGRIFAQPNIILIGLNSIMLYNDKIL